MFKKAAKLQYSSGLKAWIFPGRLSTRRRRIEPFRPTTLGKLSPTKKGEFVADKPVKNPSGLVERQPNSYPTLSRAPGLADGGFGDFPVEDDSLGVGNTRMLAMCQAMALLRGPRRLPELSLSALAASFLQPLFTFSGF